MIFHDPEQTLAFMRGETNDPGVVQAVRGGIQWPVQEVPVTTRHEFLAQLHETLKPRGYLEVGVYSGDSLRLVRPGTPAIGIDPSPMLLGHFPGTTHVFRVTSDEFFADVGHATQIFGGILDLAFIDGMHLYEYALRDFRNIEKYANPRTVVVFDDVLPRNQEEAAREQCPGDWTGDVWKVHLVLTRLRPSLTVHLVNTAPTGTMVVWGLNPLYRWEEHVVRALVEDRLNHSTPVPDDVLQRTHAVEPEWVLSEISLYLLSQEAQ